MQMKLRSKKFTSLLLCMMLIVAMALTTTGCGDKQEDNNSKQNQEISSEDITVLGEGQTTFLFTVVDKDGNETYFEINVVSHSVLGNNTETSCTHYSVSPNGCCRYCC